jgi:hypothetical protein
MARYAKFFSLGGGAGPNGLQLPLGTILDATLRQVQDGTGTGSPLYLSTGGLRVGTTAGSAMYWDDVNNRLGVGTTTPLGILHLKRTADTTRMVMDGDAGQSKIITYRTAGLQRFGLYVNNTAESGSNVGSDFAIRAYNDAGTLITTALFIKRSTGNVGINTLTGTAKLQVVGSGSTSSTTSLLVQNSLGNYGIQILDSTSVGVNSLLQTCFNTGGGADVNSGVRILATTAGVSYIDGYSEGPNKTNNYPIVIGARVNNTGGSRTGSTTAENGSQVFFGSEVISASAQVGINSTTRGFLPPRMTTAQKNAISSPANGLIVYDTDLVRPCFFNGATWITL